VSASGVEGGGAPVVSVVVPTRDRWSLLADTLASALAAEEVGIEVIIVDDGSTSPAPAAPPFTDPRVRIVRNDVSLGVSRARNRGIEEARGEWVAFLDDDDVWAPRKLRRQLDAAAATGATFAYAAVILVTAESGLVTVAEAPPPARLAELLGSFNAIPAGASNVVVRAELLREAGGFDPDFTHLADWDLWIRLAAAGLGAACSEPLVGYRLHPASMRSTAGGAVAELGRLDQKHGRSGRSPVGRIWFYRWLVDGQLLAGRSAAAATTSLRGALRCRSPSDARRAARVLLRRGTQAPRPAPEPSIAAAGWLRPLRPAPIAQMPDSMTATAKQGMRRLGAATIDRALRASSLRAGIAIVYHGVDDGRSNEARPVDIVGSVPAATFRSQVDHVRSTYRLVTACELPAAVAARRRGERFPLAITFDDDLRSHLDTAVPILTAAGAPATFFLTGASLKGPASFWWERLERALETGVGDDLLGTADPDAAVAAVASMSAADREALSAALLERLGGEEEEAGLRAAQVAAIALDHEIGFHTRTHERLPPLGDDELGVALADGAEALAAAAGGPLRTVAYPYGEADTRVAAAARGAGFRCGYTTRGVAVRADADPFLMGRLYPSSASIAHFASQLSHALRRAAGGG
jgi:peptidoglycan/xylan/chitin deacetylase (PgdA/CDA1 family)